MPKRMIDTDLFVDEHFGKLSDKAKLMFISCILHADDDGRLSGNSNNLRAMSYRFEDIKLSEVEALVSEIDKEMVNFELYSVNGCKYIQLANWGRYQYIKPDRKRASKIPINPNGDICADKCHHRLDKIRLDKINIECEKEVKTKHLDYVLLTKKEYELLRGRFGENVTTSYISRLNDYIGSKGKKYKSHYHTICMWISKNEPLKDKKTTREL